jgi:PAT family beta-lactamase induction signal transducer AmpG
MNNETRSPSIWATTLYYAQGLPFSIVRQVSVVFFKEQGVSLQSLGLIALYGIPWTFKFLWSPFVDQFSKKRRWIVVMELLLASMIGVVAFLISQKTSPIHIAAAFLVVAFLAATHDIAVDGFFLEALSKDKQAKYSGWIVASYRVALLTGSGVLISLSAKFSWPIIFLAVAVVFFILSFWHSFILPKPETVSVYKKMSFIKGFESFLALRGVGIAIAFIIFFKLGDALLFGMSTPFLLDAGMPKSKLGLISGVFGTLAAVSASIGGGWFISRYSLRRGLKIFAVVQTLAIPIYALVATIKPGVWILATAVIVEQISAGLGTAAYTNFVMRQNNAEYRATHYAIATGLMSVTTMMGGVMSGFGAQHFGYPLFFTLAFIASVPGLFLVPVVARRPECQ